MFDQSTTPTKVTGKSRRGPMKSSDNMRDCLQFPPGENAFSHKTDLLARRHVNDAAYPTCFPNLNTDPRAVRENAGHLIHGEPSSNFPDLIREAKENVYRSINKEPLGRSSQPLCPLPARVTQPAFAFGVPVRQS